MEQLTLLQWWNVLSELLWVTGCSLFEAVDFMIGKYGEPNPRERISQNFEDATELD